MLLSLVMRKNTSKKVLRKKYCINSKYTPIISFTNDIKDLKSIGALILEL